MFLDKITPKKFICHYTLKTGCFCYGILLAVVMALCTIGLIVETFGMSECTYCSIGVTSFSITAIVYSITMLCVNIWLIWGVNNKKTSVVISWIVITAMWLAQVTCLLIVLLCLYIKASKPIAWIVLLIIALSIPLYGLLIGYGYWRQLKSERRTPSPT